MRIIHKIVPAAVRRIQKPIDYAKWRLARSSFESVYFYTFHKCASSLFSNLILKQAQGLRHVDYEQQHYRGEQIGKVLYDRTGYVYGPIRLSHAPHVVLYQALYDPASQYYLAEHSALSPEFIRDKLAVFVIRDPRDILVSQYFSYAISHTFSPDAETAASQSKFRSQLQDVTVDQYARDRSPRVLGEFALLAELTDACDRAVVIRYEDIVEDWDKFEKAITSIFRFKPNTLRLIYKKTRPRESENVNEHRRSGKWGQFKEHLTEETCAGLNKDFKSVLDKYGYEI